MAQLRYPDRNTYFLITQSRVGVSRLADQEALDLDLDPFMSFCDHTSSAPGCQFLYDSLRSPDSDGGIPARHEHLIDTLSENNVKGNRRRAEIDTKRTRTPAAGCMADPKNRYDVTFTNL